MTLRGVLSGRSGSIVPGGDEVVDAVALIALTMIGIVGFRPAYGGHGYLAAGAAGVVIGRTAQPRRPAGQAAALAVVAASLLAFLLLGGVVSQTGTRQPAGAPHGRRRGGLRLAATADHRAAGRPHRGAARAALPARPVQRGGRARARPPHQDRACCPPRRRPPWSRCPSCSARRSRPPPCSRGPVRRGALAWAAVRQQRGAGAGGHLGRQRPWQRIGAAVARARRGRRGRRRSSARTCQARTRTSASCSTSSRRSTSAAYPSPLAGFRDYTQDVPAGLSVYARNCSPPTGCRRAAWSASRRWTPMTGSPGASPTRRPRASSFGGFQRVGALLPAAVPGPTRTATITIQPAYEQPWLPDLADTTGFTFSGGPGPPVPPPRCRFNVATTTGIIPGGVPCRCATRSAPRRAAPRRCHARAAAPAGAPTRR